MRPIRRIPLLLAAAFLSAGCGRWFFDLSGTRCSQEEPDCGPELVCDLQQQLCVEPSSLASDGGADSADAGTDADAGSDAGSDAGTGPDGFCAPGLLRCDEGRACCETYRLALGDSHSCAAIKLDGSVDRVREVRCWGDNAASQTGQPESGPKPSPVEVTQLRGKEIVELAAGANHTCAIAEGGELFCWGANDKGQIEQTREIISQPEPTRPTVIIGSVTHVAAGGGHTCAIDTANGDPPLLICWGDNARGQLGIGAPIPGAPTMDHQVGAAQLGDGLPQQVAAGATHTCAVVIEPDQSQRVSCWGSFGQIGVDPGSSSGDARDGSARVMLEGPGGPELMGSTIQARASWSCAQVTNPGVSDGLVCWGAGACFAPSNQTPFYAMELPDLPQGFEQLAMGKDHVCFLWSGEVECLGSNVLGQLGRPAEALELTAGPIKQVHVAPFTVLASGTNHSCAATSAGRLFCWGANGKGQLGRRTAADWSALPGEVDPGL